MDVQPLQCHSDLKCQLSEKSMLARNATRASLMDNEVAQAIWGTMSRYESLSNPVGLKSIHVQSQTSAIATPLRVSWGESIRIIA